MNYYEFIKSPAWQRQRLEVMQRDGFKCMNCLSTEKQLNVHHLKYEKDLSMVSNDNLTTLCKDCHSMLENAKKEVISLINTNTDADYFWNLQFLLEQMSKKDLENLALIYNDSKAAEKLSKHLEKTNSKLYTEWKTDI